MRGAIPLLPHEPSRLMLRKEQGQMYLFNNLFVLTQGNYLRFRKVQGSFGARSVFTVATLLLAISNWQPVRNVQQSWAFWPGCK